MSIQHLVHFEPTVHSTDPWPTPLVINPLLLERAMRMWGGGGWWGWDHWSPWWRPRPPGWGCSGRTKASQHSPPPPTTCPALFPSTVMLFSLIFREFVLIASPTFSRISLVNALVSTPWMPGISWNISGWKIFICHNHFSRRDFLLWKIHFTLQWINGFGAKYFAVENFEILNTGFGEKYFWRSISSQAQPASAI